MRKAVGAKMKKNIIMSLILFVTSFSAYADSCGSIACNTAGGCVGLPGFDSQTAAEIAALSQCQADGSKCYIYKSECNTCIDGPKPGQQLCS
jgi:hypothetical protein